MFTLSAQGLAMYVDNWAVYVYIYPQHLCCGTNYQRVGRGKLSWITKALATYIPIARGSCCG